MNVDLNLRRLFGSIVWYAIFYFVDFWPSCQLVIVQFLETTRNFLVLLGVTFSFCLIYFPLFWFWKLCGTKAYLELKKHIPIRKISAVSKAIQAEAKHLWDYIAKGIETKSGADNKESSSQ